MPSLVLAALHLLGSAAVVLPYAALVALIVACFGPWIRRDPIGGASIVVPGLVFLLAGASWLPSIVGPSVAAVWLLAWLSPLAKRAWPWWEQTLLRRFRPGSPEREMRDTLNFVWEITRRPRSQEALDEGWQELRRAESWIRPHTLPLLSGLQSWLQVVYTGTERDGERVWTRCDQELGRLNRWVRRPWERARIEAEQVARPTRGSCLEYEYPRLEALLAAGSDAEQGAMRTGAARIALAGADLLTADREATLRAALAGSPTPDQRAEALAAPSAAGPATDDDRDTRMRIYRERRALRAFSEAIEDVVWPRDAADAIYAAVQSQADRRDIAALESIMVEILGPERAALAEEIPAKWKDKTSDGEAAEQRAILTMIPPTPRAIAWLAASTFVAGTLAHLFGHGFHAIFDTWDAAFHVALVGALMPFLLIAIRLRGARLDDADIWPSYYVAMGTLLGGSYFVPAAIHSIGGHQPEIVYALLEGIACTAATFVVYAILKSLAPRRRDASGERAPERTAAA